MTFEPDPSTQLRPARKIPTRAETLRGLGFMAAGFFLYATADMFSKVLTAEFHPIQIAWVRQLGLLVGVLFLLRRYGPTILRSARPVLQVLRGLTAVITSTTFVMAVVYVPLASRWRSPCHSSGSRPATYKPCLSWL